MIGSKKDVAADVARAASQIRVVLYKSRLRRDGQYVVKLTVSDVTALVALTKLHLHLAHAFKTGVVAHTPCNCCCYLVSEAYLLRPHIELRSL